DGLDGSPDWVQFPAGEFEMGSPGAGFAYDNERPRHAVELAAFAIARRPVSSRSWMQFSEAGGDERPEGGARGGWAGKQGERLSTHPAIRASTPQARAGHVSW